MIRQTEPGSAGDVDPIPTGTSNAASGKSRKPGSMRLLPNASRNSARFTSSSPTARRRNARLPVGMRLATSVSARAWASITACTARPDNGKSYPTLLRHRGASKPWPVVWWSAKHRTVKTLVCGGVYTCQLRLMRSRVAASVHLRSCPSPKYVAVFRTHYA